MMISCGLIEQIFSLSPTLYSVEWILPLSLSLPFSLFILGKVYWMETDRKGEREGEDEEE